MVDAAAALLGLQTCSLVLLGWGQLGFLAGLTGLSLLLKRRQAPEKLLRMHGALTALLILWVTSLGLLSPLHATPLLAVTLGLAVSGLFLARRIETAVVIPFTLAAVLFTGFLPPGHLTALFAVAAGMLLFALASPVLEPLLGRWTDVSLEDARRALLLPALALSLLAAVPAAAAVLIDHDFSSLACLDVLIAGAVWMVAGYRLRWPSRFTMGALMASLGAHGALLFQIAETGSHPQAWLAVLTQALFVLIWLAARASRPGGQLDASMHNSLRGLTILHGVLGLAWMASAGTSATVEPLILLLSGLSLLWEGLADRKQEGTHHEGIDLGLTLAVLWLPVQILVGVPGSWSWLLVAGLTLAGLELGLLVFAARRSAGHWLARRSGMDLEDWDVLTALSLRGLVRVWLVLAAAAGLLFAGWEAAGPHPHDDGRPLPHPYRYRRLGPPPCLPRAAYPAAPPPARRAGRRPGQSGPGPDPRPLRARPGPAPLDRGLRPGLARPDRDPRPPPVAARLDARRRIRHRPGLSAGLLRWLSFAPWTDAALIALARLLVGRLPSSTPGATATLCYGWQMQAWAGLAVLHAFTAGWLYLGSGVAPYVILAVGAAQYALGAFYERKDPGASITPSCRFGWASGCPSRPALYP